MSDSHLGEMVVASFALGMAFKYARKRVRDYLDDRAVAVRVQNELAQGWVSPTTIREVDSRIGYYGDLNHLSRPLRTLMPQLDGVYASYHQ